MVAHMRLPLLTIVAFCLTGCGASDLCSNTLVEKLLDPSGTRVAYHYIRDCGATTDYATSIAIGALGEDTAQADVVFTADSGHGAAKADGEGIWLRMTWARPGMLLVSHAEKARIFRQEGQARGARISYRASDDPVARPVP
ncbi:hypothetical protein [Sphingomonas alpina]|nr:hypothetical protein [Sphingomonas alpina]